MVLVTGCRGYGHGEGRRVERFLQEFGRQKFVVKELFGMCWARDKLE